MRERPIIFGTESVRAILAGTKTQTRRVVKPQPDEGYAVDYNPDGSARERRSYTWSWDRRRNGARVDVSEMPPHCPHGHPGDRLWVRETFITGWPSIAGDIQSCDEDGNDLPEHVWFKAEHDDTAWISNHGARMGEWTGDDGFPRETVPWRSPILMPRWASRLTLEITGVRVERLQEISEADAIAEGAALPMLSTPEATARLRFADAWDAINGSRRVPSGAWQADVLAPRTVLDDSHSWASNPWCWVLTFRRVAA